ncbi:MAG TPA: MarR family transcriptional regulator [Kineosporiaceae bacterium]
MSTVDCAPVSPDADLVETAMSASRALLGIVVRSLAPVLEEITPGQLRALVILGSQGAQRAGVLASMLGVHPSTFTRTVDRLAAGGWVTRSENPDSRREVLVELTARGERAVAAVTRGRRRELAQVLASLSPADQRRVVDGLEIFAQACGEPSLTELARLGG